MILYIYSTQARDKERGGGWWIAVEAVDGRRLEKLCGGNRECGLEERRECERKERERQTDGKK